MKERADKAIVKRGLASTRSQARLMIDEGVVYYRNQLVNKAGQLIGDGILEIRKIVQYVGRGGHKLEHAIVFFGTRLQDKVVADIGASTGGFTDYLIKNGAKKVFAVDVGHGQLADKLSTNSQVVNLEGVNVKYPFDLGEMVDLSVVDLSFISLRLVLENIFKIVKENGKVIVLVKPQFEAGSANLGKNGLVKDAQTRLSVLLNLYDWCCERKMYLANATRSPITGKSGNTEYFFYFDKELSHLTYERSNLEKM